MGNVNTARARGMAAGIPASLINEWYPLGTPAHVATLANVPGLQYERDVWRAHRSHLCLIDREIASPDLDLPEIPFKLRPWQHEAVAFLRHRRGVLLTDEMRVGKTVEALAAWEPSEGQLCVVAPLAAHPNWLTWIKRRAPGVKIAHLEGRTFISSQLEAPVVLMHYEILPFWQSLNHKPRVLVFDEMHLLSHGNAKRTQAALTLSTRATQVWGLTGSPLWNHPAGLHAILSCLSPGAWGRWGEFAIRYAGGVRGKYGLATARPTNMVEFHARCAEIVFGRTWAEIGIAPGHVTREVEEVQISWETSTQIDLQLAEVLSRTKAGGRLAALGKARKLLGDVKAKTAVELAQATIEPTVVWCWHVGIAKVIATLLAGQFGAREGSREVFLVTGKQTAKERQTILAAWRKSFDGVLVATISVAQVGIDLSHAAACIFAELDFTPANISQAEMRTFSPDRPMHVTYVATNHAADMNVIHALCRKQADGDALGLRAAEGAVAILGDLFGVTEKPDLERLFKAVAGPLEIEA